MKTKKQNLKKENRILEAEKKSLESERKGLELEAKYLEQTNDFLEKKILRLEHQIENEFPEKIEELNTLLDIQNLVLSSEDLENMNTDKKVNIQMFFLTQKRMINERPNQAYEYN